MSRSSLQPPPRTRQAAYFELRVGGFRITADHIPARFLAMTSSATSGLVAWWLSR
ncbi:hypothetical protein AB0M68_34260 [Streptomyces sp. NPDC051453]|uniref:hypothetical protein n=1 Tax=Streptomyces sp. NPDC051453 TaxID=3154941 RepID=UPI0034452311